MAFQTCDSRIDGEKFDCLRSPSFREPEPELLPPCEASSGNAWFCNIDAFGAICKSTSITESGKDNLRSNNACFVFELCIEVIMTLKPCNDEGTVNAETWCNYLTCV